jgi:hypothetical protein
VQISGFTFVRNAVSLGYPLEESLRSALAMVDELVVVVARAEGEADDGTRALVAASLDDARIRVLDARWDRARGALAYSDLTNRALGACAGDWCLYLQADEVLHEDDLDTIRRRCTELLENRRVEGLLFDYLHFFGDYTHVQRGQGWYPREIRVVRNRAAIRSVRDAQSFRRGDGGRLTVARSGARVFHYGWARHPALMQVKTREFWSHRVGADASRAHVGDGELYDYGPLARLSRWTGVHPAVMAERIAGMDWGGLLRETDAPGTTRARHKDERPLYRFLTGLSRLTGIDLNHKNHGRVLRV